MTKLYHGPEGQGWQIPGAQDRKAARVDVPSSPAELAAWLNERHVWAKARVIDREQIGLTGESPDLTWDELESLGAGEASCNTAAGGAVLTAADVAKVNGGRPSFLPDLTADEIERRRMALGQCPKCGTVKPNWLRQVIDGLPRASIDELEAAANAIRDHAAELNEQHKQASEGRAH